MKDVALLIQDPLVLVDRSGRVLDMNGPARNLFGDRAPERAAAIFAADGLRRLMELSSQTAQPVIGALSATTAGGEHKRFQARAVVTHRLGHELDIAIQLLDRGRDQFKLLSQRVAELNREIAARRALQARLEASLTRNKALFRELQHRVRNHVQMILGLVSLSRREAESPAQEALIEKLEWKLRAVCEAQRLMYGNDDASGISAPALLNALAQLYQDPAGAGAEMIVEADPIVIQNDAAFPLSLIVNELLANAVTHGSGHRIDVALRRTDQGLALRVRDTGHGLFAGEAARRSSGLGLVSGLCGQLGAQVEVATDDGAVVQVLFPRELSRHD